MHRRAYLLFTIAFFILGVIFFSLAIQQYRVLTSSRAAGDTISLKFYDKRGPIDQKFGVMVNDITNDTTVQELKKYFSGGNIYIKIKNPTAAMIQSTQFESLQTAGFKWYLSFSNYENMTPVVQAYYAKYQDQIVVELMDYNAFDVAKTNEIKALKPDKILFHAGVATFWPREQVKDLLQRAPPPIINAISIKFENRDEDIWGYVKTMFDTMYDASKSISGDSSTKIVYPPNSMLSLSEITMPSSIVQNQIKRFSLLVSAMVTHVQTEPEKAPIKFVNGGVFDTMNVAEKTTMSLVAKQLAVSPHVVWPDAFRGNGDPWDNPFVSEYNFKPIMGTLTEKNGEYMGMLLNVSDETPTVRLPEHNYAGYKTYSNIRGATTLIDAQRQIAFQPYESIVLVPPTMTIPDGGGDDDDDDNRSGVLECDSGPDPYNSNRITIKNGTEQPIDKIEVDLFRCTYVPGRKEQYRGSYRCEGGDNACADGAASCFVGEWDGNFSQPKRNIVLQPGQSMTFEYEQTPCKTAQMDVRTENNGVESIECHNVQSSNTVPPGEMWPGGYAFAISENSTGYDPATQTCPQSTPTPTQPAEDTPTPSPSPSPSETPSPSPTHSPTPSPSFTPTPTPVPPTPTPIPPTPTFTSVPPPPTSTPVTKLEVEDQPPGMNPAIAVLIPFVLILLGLAL